MNEIKFSHLMSPGVIGGIEVRNKIVMPAMGVNMADGGYVNEAIINHYAERAKGGAGLIIIEVTCVDTPLGLNTSRMLCIDDDKYIPGFERLTGVIHRHGAKCILEISHTGRGAKQRIIGARPVGPSAIKKPYDFIVGFEGEEPRTLSVEEIQAIEDQYAAAALRAQKAGFDGVEVHATGYYLVAQFFSATANHRTDDYGGNPFNRARFALNIARKIKAKTGDDFPVFYKLSVLEIGNYGGVKLRDGLLNCYLLQQAGVAAIEVLAGAWSAHPKKNDKPDSGQAPGLTFPIARLMKLARITKYAKKPGFVFGKKALTIPLIIGGRTFDPTLAEKALAKGWGEFIFMGRGLLTQPDLPRMIAAGTYEAARPCIGCGKCIDGQLQRDERIACSGNAVVGVGANDYTIPPAYIKKRVYVIGGGPGGVEAAKIAAIRGHEVTLFEKDERLGGQLHAALTPPHKQNLSLLLKYLERQVAITGLKVRLNTEMTAERILEERPDVVICATGVQPGRLAVPGVEKPIVMNVNRALLGAPIGGEVIIIGGGIIGCEAAQLLAEKGKKVTIVEFLDRLAVKMVATSRTILLAQLERLGVEIYSSSKCKEIKNHSLVIEWKNGEALELKADTVLIAVGARPNRDLYSKLEGKIVEIYAVGDCLEPASILEAVSTGYYTALQI